MSLWAKCQELQGEALQEVQSFYGEHFPIEVRYCLAKWIEENLKIGFDIENHQHKKSDASFVDLFIQELDSKGKAEEIILTKIKLQEAVKLFQKLYYPNPSALLRMIRIFLDSECELVAQAENSSLGTNNPSGLPPDASGEILQQLEVLIKRTQRSYEYLKQMEGVQGLIPMLDSAYYSKKSHATAVESASKSSSQQTIDSEKNCQGKTESKRDEHKIQRTELLLMRKALAIHHKGTMRIIEKLQVRILDGELFRWKRNQQLVGNGVPFPSNLISLNSIQEWCEGLVEIIWFNRQQMVDADILQRKLPLRQDVPVLQTEISQLLSSLVTRSFVVEHQPPRVIKTNTFFTTVMRSLVGSKMNLLHMAVPKVTLSIINEQQGNTLLKSDKKGRKETSAELMNSTGMMEYQESSQILAVSFRNLLVSGIRCSDKKGTEPVMEERFSLLFESLVSLGGRELVFQIATVSHPVIFIATDEQEPRAWATVTWDNSFAGPGRTSLVVSEEVQWGRIAEALSSQFRMATGRALTESNQKYLSSKALRNPSLQQPLVDSETINDMMLTWSQFCKEPLPQSNFTFWDWFNGLIELTRCHLRAYWMDGIIVGFIDRKSAVGLLKGCTSGTFVLRFSDFQLGGVEIAWVGENNQVFLLPALTSKDFAIHSLAERVSDMKDLIYVYPDVAKEKVFGGFNCSRSPKVNIKSQESPSHHNVISETGPARTPCVTDAKTEEKGREVKNERVKHHPNVSEDYENDKTKKAERKKMVDEETNSNKHFNKCETVKYDLKAWWKHK